MRELCFGGLALPPLLTDRESTDLMEAFKCEPFKCDLFECDPFEASLFSGQDALEDETALGIPFDPLLEWPAFEFEEETTPLPPAPPPKKKRRRGRFFTNMEHLARDNDPNFKYPHFKYEPKKQCDGRKTCCTNEQRALIKVVRCSKTIQTLLHGITAAENTFEGVKAFFSKRFLKHGIPRETAKNYYVFAKNASPFITLCYPQLLDYRIRKDNNRREIRFNPLYLSVYQQFLEEKGSPLKTCP